MEGLRVMKAWGFTYKANIVWFKVRKDSRPDGQI
jgi:N6-adenosine-specific RNA methylase IME4